VTAAGRPIALVLAAAIAVLGFKSGGYFPPMWSWLTFAFAGVLLAGVALGTPRRWSPLEVTIVAALAALAGWTLLSATWSVDPSQSVREAERALVYLAAVAAILLLGDSRRIRELTVAVCGAISVVVSYALLDYLFSSHPGPEGFEGFLLFRPIGYANALGILATIAALLALGLVDADESRLVRCLGAAALVPLAATLVLTSSRGALVALALGFAVMLDVASQRLRLTTSSLIVTPAPLLAAALSAHADLLTGTPFFRSHRAEHLGIALIVLTVAAGFCGLLLRNAYSRRAAVTAVSVTAACSVALVAFAGASGRTPGYGGPRSDYWHVAQREWQSRPLTGTGAGTFGTYWRREGTAQGAQDAHNLYLETLAELGVVGLALLVAVLIPPLVAFRSARREPLVPALLAAYAAYLLHAAVDWDWEMPVVTVAALACGAGLLLAARVGEPRPMTHLVRIGLAGLSAALLLVSCVELFTNDAITL
jgi:O-Antigen ligase